MQMLWCVLATVSMWPLHTANFKVPSPDYWLDKPTVLWIKDGSGESLRPGDWATVDLVVTTPEGVELANTHLRGLPLRFQVGSAQADPLMLNATEGMSLGAEREVVLPAIMAYGEAGRSPFVPQNTPLRVRVRVLAIQRLDAS
jgi:FKBP-type peptidyl-prolyl cis-trans isomerase